MSREVKTRLAALEAQSIGEDAIRAIHRTFVRPGLSGPVACEPIAVTSGGRRVERLDDEGVAAFRARAAGLALRGQGGVARLVDVLERP